MIYRFCKIKIRSGNYNRDDMMTKLDLYMLNNRITSEQYTELVGMMSPSAV